MNSTIFFVLLISGCLAQQGERVTTSQRLSRAAQGHIQYSDPDGLKVSWKLYAPYTQWKTHLENPQRNERAESGTGQPTLEPYSDFTKPESTESEPNQSQTLQQVQVHYKPYSMIPTHIKQLILEMYEPQGPYIDPAVYIYRGFNEPREEEQKQQISIEQDENVQATSPIQLNTDRGLIEHISKYQPKYSLSKSNVGSHHYKDELTLAASAIPQHNVLPEIHESMHEENHQQQQQQSQKYEPQLIQQYQQEQSQQYQQQKYQHQQEYQQQQYQQQKEQEQQRNVENFMPKELHQLLNLQAQTPYHVIANRILYKPKNIFVPKPISEDIKGPYKYRSKIYFIQNEDINPKNQKQSERGEKNEQEQE